MSFRTVRGEPAAARASVRRVRALPRSLAGARALAAAHPALTLLALALLSCGPPPPAPTGAPLAAPAPAPLAPSSPLTPPAPSSTPPGPSGALATIDGQRVLHLWGTPAAMGHAHGYLLRDAIIALVDDYALEALPPATFAAAAPHFERVATIAPALRDEAAGVIDGMKAAGGAHIPGLGRDLAVADLLFVNALTDWVAIGCSSVSAWGPSTRADPELAGDLAVVRNLDWADHPTLLESQVIFAFDPQDPRAQRVVSVAFAGYLGCLSCVNEAGVAALFNMAYGAGASRARALAGFAPANLLLRAALGERDHDGDGRSTADDLVAALREATHAGSYLVHLVEPAAPGASPARVLEVEAAGVAVREPAADSPLGPAALAATNHLRALAPPTACSRYRRIERSARATAGEFTREGLWRLGESLRLDDQVVHTILVEPRARRLRVRMRAPGRTMDASPPPVEHPWERLFHGRPAPAAIDMSHGTPR